MMLLRGFVGTGTPLVGDASPLLVLVEGTVPKEIVIFPGLAAMKGLAVKKRLAVRKGFVAVKGFVVTKGFVELTGLVGTSVLPFTGPLPFASLAHTLPQYECTMAPSLYLGFVLQYLGEQNHSAIS